MQAPPQPWWTRRRSRPPPTCDATGARICLPYCNKWWSYHLILAVRDTTCDENRPCKTATTSWSGATPTRFQYASVSSRGGHYEQRVYTRAIRCNCHGRYFRIERAMIAFLHRARAATTTTASAATAWPPGNDLGTSTLDAARLLQIQGHQRQDNCFGTRMWLHLPTRPQQLYPSSPAPT